MKKSNQSVLQEAGKECTVEPSIDECLIKVQSPEKNDHDEQVTCCVTISLTSPLMRNIGKILAHGFCDMSL